MAVEARQVAAGGLDSLGWLLLGAEETRDAEAGRRASGKKRKAGSEAEGQSVRRPAGRFNEVAVQNAVVSFLAKSVERGGKERAAARRGGGEPARFPLTRDRVRARESEGEPRA